MKNLWTVQTFFKHSYTFSSLSDCFIWKRLFGWRKLTTYSFIQFFIHRLKKTIFLSSGISLGCCASHWSYKILYWALNVFRGSLAFKVPRTSTHLFLHREIVCYCQTYLLLFIQSCYINFTFKFFSHCYFYETWRNLLKICWSCIITLRSNHLYLIDLLIKCFKQLDKCFS